NPPPISSRPLFSGALEYTSVLNRLTTPSKEISFLPTAATKSRLGTGFRRSKPASIAGKFLALGLPSLFFKKEYSPAPFLY
ncbi:hypothetical protein, partial [Alicycliphilus denitrificans]|uniref:hypothetical protein n=1 Tax=Alicycliphilus denitrificans TaxID=179636 RepID=UPI001CA4DBA9